MGVTRGLGPTGPMAAMAQQCDAAMLQNQWMVFIFAMFGICVLALFAKLAWRAWKMLEWRLGSLETLVQCIRTDVSSAQHQLADHYEFAAGLDKRIDGINGSLATAEEHIDALALQEQQKLVMLVSNLSTVLGMV